MRNLKPSSLNEILAELYEALVEDSKHINIQTHVEEEIFDGAFFETYHKFTIPNSSSVFYRLTTSDEVIMFLGSSIRASGGDIDVLFYEKSNYAGGTAPLALRNRLLSNSDPSSVTYTVNPTGTVKGNLIGGTIMFSAGTNQTRNPQESAGGQGFIILEPNTTYLAEFKNNTTSGSATAVVKSAWCSADDDINTEIQGD